MDSEGGEDDEVIVSITGAVSCFVRTAAPAPVTVAATAVSAAPFRKLRRFIPGSYVSFVIGLLIFPETGFLAQSLTASGEKVRNPVSIFKRSLNTQIGAATAHLGAILAQL
jgi:hypothetical protein